MIGNPTVLDVNDGVLTEHINTAYREIGNKFRFHLVRKICTFDTISGVSRYGLPVDVAVILRMRNNTSEIRMEKVDSRRRYQQQNYTANVQLGVPKGYIRYRDWVEMIPIPDGVYQIELFYKISLVDLSADSNVPVIPESWHRGIVLLARYNYFDDEGDIPKSIDADNKYKTWLADQPVEVDEEARDFDVSVEIPELGGWNGQDPRLDFNHADD